MSRLGRDPGPLRTGDLNEDVLTELREECKTNLFVLAKGVLGYRDMTHRTHKGLCDEFVRPGNRKLILMPRGHFKTTVDMADCIRMLACDPNERILLSSESGENAESMLTEIKGHLTDNPILQAVFPHIIPKDINQTTWSRKGILLPRPGNFRELSIEAAGVTSKLVSRHYTTIKVDDPISDEAMYSPTVMKKAKDFMNRLVSLLTKPADTIHVIGTRWAFDDVYGHLLDKFPEYTTFIRKAIVEGPDGPEPLFAERYDMDTFHRILANDPDQWATQYANDPTDTTLRDFKPSWLQYCRLGPDRGLRWTDAHGQLQLTPLRSLRFYIHVDPSLGENQYSDYSGIVVVGLAPGRRVFVVEAIGLRLDPLALPQKILELAKFYDPKRITIESNAYQKAAMYYLEKEAREQRIYINVEPSHSPSGKQKPARIRAALGPWFSTGSIWIREGLNNIVEEYMQFGRAKDQHLLDAFAQGPEFWKFPENEAVRMRRVKEHARVPSRGITGYGA